MQIAEFDPFFWTSGLAQNTQIFWVQLQSVWPSGNVAQTLRFVTRHTFPAKPVRFAEPPLEFPALVGELGL